MRLLLDTHLDLGFNALSLKRDLTLPLEVLNRREAGMTDALERGRATVSLPEMRRGGVFVCLATLLARAPREEDVASAFRSRFAYPCQDIASAAAQGQLAYYQRLAARKELSLIRSQDELARHRQRWEAATESTAADLPVGAIIAFEGCDAIVEPDQARWWFEQGVRCGSLVHYGSNRYAVGTGEDGPLTEDGRTLLGQMQACGLILDATHLCDTSFYEAMEIYSGPVFASHQNCRALVPGVRQFSDPQIRLIIERGGVLGTACDAWMLHPGWVRGATLDAITPRSAVSIDALADHIDHVCQLAGNHRHAALGSDLDGGFGTEQTPAGLDSIADLQQLAATLSGRGYSDEEIDDLFHGNWLRFFGTHLPA